VSCETEDTDNLGLLPSQQWKHWTHYAEGDSLNCNLEESTHVVVDHGSSGERNEIFGICKVSTPDKWDCIPSLLKQRKVTTCIIYKEDTKAASLVESSDSKDQTTILKFDSRDESSEPQPLLGASPLDRSISLPYSTQESAGRSINVTYVSTDRLSANKINNSYQNSQISKLILEIGPGLNLPQDQPINTMISPVPVMNSQVSEAPKSEENSYFEAISGHPWEVLNISGVVQSSSSGPDENHSTKPQENDGSTLHETARKQSTRIHPLTMRALEAFACGFFSSKRRRKGSEKTLKPDIVT